MSEKYRPLIWFVGLWLVGVTTISFVAFLLKLIMKWVNLIN
jgi:hypothetical protein